MNASMGSLIGNANLIKKVYFPREVFVVSRDRLAARLVPDRAGRARASILLIMGNMVLPWIPVVLVLVVIQSFFVLGIGLPAERAQRLLPRRAAPRRRSLLMALFYSAPIVYPISVVPEKAHVPA